MQLKGLHLAEILEDPGVSGGKALSTRPAGAKLLWPWHDGASRWSSSPSSIGKEQITWMRQWQKDGKSLRQIAALLDDQGGGTHLHLSPTGPKRTCQIITLG